METRRAAIAHLESVDLLPDKISNTAAIQRPAFSEKLDSQPGVKFNPTCPRTKLKSMKMTQ